MFVARDALYASPGGAPRASEEGAMSYRGIGRQIFAAMRTVLCFVALCFVAQGAYAQTVDQDLARCPTAAEVASVSAKLTLIFDNDPTGSALACTAQAGSANLTLLQKRAYNVALALQRLRFDTPLPWSAPATASLWEWFVNQAGITGIHFSFSGTGGNSYCCSPANVINIIVSPNSYLFLTDRWDTYTTGVGGYGGGLGDALALYVHEARHNQGQIHDCSGGNDNTFEQMGAWAVQSLLWYWIANHGDVNYLRPATAEIGNDYYQDDARNRSESARSTHICRDTRSLQTASDFEFYNASLGHYFMTADAHEAMSIEAGAAGPGWSRTQKSFKVFPDAGHAPMNALPVCRFYGTPGLGPNSHFYTLDPVECAAVKQDPGWTFEGVVFYMLKPYFDHSCPVYNQVMGSYADALRVWRSYNNRAPQMDANHRYASDPAVYSQMSATGWGAENVVMCTPE
jgi:hypothetical protein